MLHLGAICRCPDLSGKSTQQPNTALSPYIHMVPIHVDCRCPQREGGIEDQQEQWGCWPCLSNTGDHCPTLRSPQNSPRSSFPVQMGWGKTGVPCRLTSSHLLLVGLCRLREMFLVPRAGEIRMGERKGGKNNSFVHPDFLRWLWSIFFKWVWLSFTGNDFF